MNHPESDLLRSPKLKSESWLPIYDILFVCNTHIWPNADPQSALDFDLLKSLIDKLKPNGAVEFPYTTSF